MGCSNWPGSVLALQEDASLMRYEGKLWFLDERLRQLRNVGNPHDFINLNNFKVEYFMRTEG